MSALTDTIKKSGKQNNRQEAGIRSEEFWKLSPEDKERVRAQKKFDYDNNQCYKCHQPGHRARHCKDEYQTPYGTVPMNNTQGNVPGSQ